MAEAEGVDGHQLKDFVEDPKKFNKFVDKKFTELDSDKKGTVTKDELIPLMGNLGEALGLPPIGTSKETDHIYNEIFVEFSQGNGVTKEVFASVLQDVFLGLADGLERDPVTVVHLDGEALREYAKSGRFDVDAVSTFTGLDTKDENKLQGSLIIEALKSIGVGKGMPPGDDGKLKDIVKEALVKSNVNVQESYEQIPFTEKFKAVVLVIADEMGKSPVEVAYCERTYDGKTITSLLKDETTLHQVLDAAWEKMPKDNKGKVSNKHMRKGVDEVAPAAGLPPIGAVDEMDDVLKTVFSKINFEDSVTVTKEQFDKIMLEILGSLMLQLDGKSISVEKSEIVSDETAKTPVV